MDSREKGWGMDECVSERFGDTLSVHSQQYKSMFLNVKFTVVRSGEGRGERSMCVRDNG
jgi:hypothetical protein